MISEASFMVVYLGILGFLVIVYTVMFLLTSHKTTKETQALDESFNKHASKPTDF